MVTYASKQIACHSQRVLGSNHRCTPCDCVAWMRIVHKYLKICLWWLVGGAGWHRLMRAHKMCTSAQWTPSCNLPMILYLFPDRTTGNTQGAACNQLTEKLCVCVCTYVHPSLMFEHVQLCTYSLVSTSTSRTDMMAWWHDDMTCASCSSVTCPYYMY